jgi:hypothetical protein|tara:strand:+ start:580 stop:1011 length:432 start_codon:yes stop_codon:yes gene_type:complete
MTKEVFGKKVEDEYDFQAKGLQMSAHYIGLTSTNNLESWDVEFSLNDYSMKSLLKKTTRSTFAISSWLEDSKKQESNKKHWVLFGVSGLVDPFNMSPSARDQRLKTLKFRKVDENTYNNFEKYIQTKNTLYFTKARRSSMESV